MSEKILSIGVHIWTPGNVGYPQGKPEIENDIKYISARNSRLSKGPNGQILLVVDNFFHDTKDRLQLGEEWEGSLIRTHLGTPRPIGGDFKSLRELILEQYPADGYEIWGTEVYLRDGKPKHGCVKGALDNLRLPRSRIDIDSCWTAPLPKGNPWRNALANALSPGWLMP